MRAAFCRARTVGLELAAYVGCLLVGQTVWGQPQYDRRSRDEPEVCLEAGGRYGTCDVLGFTPDGTYLYAAGDDKVVRLWPCVRTSAEGLRLENDVTQVRALRWRAWRDQLGGIKAVAISSDGRRLAVGGYGLRISSVALLERDSGRTLAITWPRSGEAQTHYDAVTALAFHPDGERVAFGTADGSIWLWKPAKLSAAEADGRMWSAPVRVGRCVPPVGSPAPYNFPRTLRFEGPHALWAVCWSGRVWSFDLQGSFSDQPQVPPPVGKVLFDLQNGLYPRYAIHQAAWSPDGKWLAAATAGPRIVLCSWDGRQRRQWNLPPDHFPRCLSWRADSRQLAIGVGAALPAPEGTPRFYMEGDDHIRLYDVPSLIATDASTPMTFQQLSHRGRVEALAYHPRQMDYLAVAGGDADEVTLLRVSTPTGSAASIVRGLGRRLYGVNLSEDGTVLGIQVERKTDATHPNSRGVGSWVCYDLQRLRPTADVNHRWIGVREQDGGWQIVPDLQSRFVWYVERQGEDGRLLRLRLGLDPNLDQAPTCYTFVPTPEGRPRRLLVGHYYGCSLFELDPGRVRPHPDTGVPELPRSKLFIGHGAEVNAVVADSRGQWFVTAAADQTVAAWSLADWPSQAELGARFIEREGQLAVVSVDVGSPAWEAGLSVGDVLDLLAVGGRLLWDRRPQRPPVGKLEQAWTALRQPQSGVEYFFSWRTAGVPRSSLTRLKQRPLWKWFPVFDEQGRLYDAVLWMWHGNYYHTISLYADRYIGWHVNNAVVDGTPQFHPLSRYQHLFCRPDVIRCLVRTRSTAEALRLARGDNPQRPTFRDVEPPALELAVGQNEVRDLPVPVQVTVRAAGNNPDLLPQRLELWLNDYRYRSWDILGQRHFRVEVEVPVALFRSGVNELVAVVHNPARGRAVSRHRLFKAMTSRASCRLFGIAVGINSYGEGDHAAELRSRGLGPLRLARADAEAIRQAWLRYHGSNKYFVDSQWQMLLDGQARLPAWRQSLAQLELWQREGKLRPDDLLIIFFSGHGDIVSCGELSAQAVAGLHKRGGAEPCFVLCCHDYSPRLQEQTALRGEELVEALVRINCRKLVLLDACRSGAVAEAGLLRRLVPQEQGPIILAACDLHEQSYEDERLGQGVFTYAILEALGSRFRAADRNSDGVLTVEELCRYVTVRVPELSRDKGETARQHPVCFPPLSELPPLPLVVR